MKNFVIHAALAAIVGLGSVSLTPMRAVAQELELNLNGNGPTIRLRDNCDPDREDCRDMRRGDRRDGRRDARREDRPRFCTEDRALDKAERMGIRRARIDSVGRRSIDVRGRDRRGERVEISFGRAPNCPVIG
jgi:hypothetical protein